MKGLRSLKKVQISQWTIGWGGVVRRVYWGRGGERGKRGNVPLMTKALPRRSG